MGIVTVKGQLEDTWEKVKGVTGQVIQKAGESRRSFISLFEFSDSAIAHDVTIPLNAHLFTFDFVFPEKGDGDWVTVWRQLFFSSATIKTFDPMSSVRGLFISSLVVAPVGMWVTALAVTHIPTGLVGANLK